MARFRPNFAITADMRILFLCTPAHHQKLIPHYARALQRAGVIVEYLRKPATGNIELSELISQCEVPPSSIFHFETEDPLLPAGLETSKIPTVCFQSDVYLYTERQIRWAKLFDHAVVFHPGFELVYEKSGHHGAFVLPWAADRETFANQKFKREFQVGWVGQIGPPTYAARARVLPELAKRFRMNQWDKSYALEEVPGVYLRSKIVVNIGRDDFPQDANMRVFDAMAAGALLLTSLPSELTQLGFEPGKDFVAYQSENQIPELVQFYLSNQWQLAEIAGSGQAKVLSEHTYDARVRSLLAHLRENEGLKKAPARNLPAEQVKLCYLDFFSAQLDFGCVKKYAKELLLAKPSGASAEAALLLGKAWLRRK